MSMIDHTLIKYVILFRTSLDLLTLNLVYFVVETGNFFVENLNSNSKIYQIHFI